MSEFRARCKMPKYKAVNPFNQLALDHLYDLSQKPRYSTSDHYPRIFVKSMQSLSKCPLEIKTFKDATALSGVGNFIAREIMNALQDHEQNENGKDNDVVNGDDEKDDKTLKTVYSSSSNARKETHGNLSTQNTNQIISTTNSKRITQQTNKVINKKRAQNSISSKNDEIKSKNKSKPRSKTNEFENRSGTHNSQRIGVTPKEMAYIRSTNESIGILTKLHYYKNWKVILLLDCREHHANSVQAKLLQYGIDCEQRQLPVGDVLWIARGEYSQNLSHSDCNSNKNNNVLLPDHIEIVLGTIIERKSLSDLASSLYGTRFEEQRLRLKHSHSTFDCENQVIFLVEGSNINEVGNCPASTLRYAMMSTRIHMGFQVIRTKNLEDTCRMFQRIHLRIVQRAFSEETKRWREQFIFDSNKKRKDGKIRRKTFDFSLDTFKTTPNIPFARTRHYLYNEMKSKVEFDRERGTKSIHAIFRAQLKQVDSMSNIKVDAISKLYKTPRALMIGYERCSTDEACEKMVEDVQLGNKIERASRVGPKSSNELSCVYTKGGVVKRWMTGKQLTVSITPTHTKKMNVKVTPRESMDSLKNDNTNSPNALDFETPKQSNKWRQNDQPTQINLSEHNNVVDNVEHEIQAFDFVQNPIHVSKNNASKFDSHKIMKQIEEYKSFNDADLMYDVNIEKKENEIFSCKKDHQPETLDLTQPSSDDENNEENHPLKSTKDFFIAKKKQSFTSASSLYNISQDDDKIGTKAKILDPSQDFLQSPSITPSRPTNTTNSSRNSPEIIVLD